MRDTPANNENSAHVPGGWGGWYLLVIAWLALLILLFYLFTKHFS